MKDRTPVTAWLDWTPADIDNLLAVDWRMVADAVVPHLALAHDALAVLNAPDDASLIDVLHHHISDFGSDPTSEAHLTQVGAVTQRLVLAELPLEWYLGIHPFILGAIDAAIIPSGQRLDSRVAKSAAKRAMTDAMLVTRRYREEENQRRDQVSLFYSALATANQPIPALRTAEDIYDVVCDIVVRYG